MKSGEIRNGNRGGVRKIHISKSVKKENNGGSGKGTKKNL